MMRAVAFRALAIGAVVLGLVSGCAPTPTDMAASAAKQLQSAVSAVTHAAASGDMAAAIADLDALERKLREATASGDITADRSAMIEASISLVRADLTAALPPSPTPTVTVLQSPVPESNEGADNPGDKSGGKDKGSSGGKGGE